MQSGGENSGVICEVIEGVWAFRNGSSHPTNPDCDNVKNKNERWDILEYQLHIGSVQDPRDA